MVHLVGIKLLTKRGGKGEGADQMDHADFLDYFAVVCFSEHGRIIIV